jgi:hypothetical protein
MTEARDRIVFGSYNSRDHQKVEAIALDLETWDIKLWLDTRQLAPGTVYGRALEDAIGHADAAVVFVGAERGRWQELEIFMLLQNQRAGRLSVLIPVLLDGAGTDAGGFLGNFQYVDFRMATRDRLSKLAKALLDTPDAKANAERRQGLQARALLRWIVQQATSTAEVRRSVERCIKASLWPEALYACSRLRSIALDRRDAPAFAESCEKTGEIHFLSGQESLAENQWAISRAVYLKYSAAEVVSFDDRVQNIRGRSRSGSMHPAS